MELRGDRARDRRVDRLPQRVDGRAGAGDGRHGHDADEAGDERVLDQVLTRILTNETNEQVLHHEISYTNEFTKRVDDWRMQTRRWTVLSAHLSLVIPTIGNRFLAAFSPARAAPPIYVVPAA